MNFVKRASTFSVLYYVVALVIAVLPPGFARADSAVLDACSQSNLRIARIGAPRAYKDVFEQLIADDEPLIPQAAGRKVCPAFSYGNDYQLLDWLENGQIDAAILSEFGAAVVKAGAPDSDSPFYYIADKWPFASGELRKHGVTLELSGGESDPQVTRSKFDMLLKEIGTESNTNARKILVDSHLSSTFPVLLSYVADRAEFLNIDVDAENGRFWTSFFSVLEFKISDEHIRDDNLVATVRGPDSRDGVDLRLTGPDTFFQDVFVYDAGFGQELFGDPVEIQTTRFRMTAIQEWLLGGSLGATRPGNGVVGDYLDLNFSVHEAGFRKQRHFRYTLNEIWTIMHEAGNDSAALVLTGGGVKAAYQTRLIDYLYGKSYLTNTSNLPQEPQSIEPLTIDYIIGTSGGALLGLFVAAIDEARNLDLTRRLWWVSENKRYVESHDLFPTLEMPRYLTLIWSGIIFALLLLFGRLWFLRRHTEIETLGQELLDREGKGNHSRPWYVWLVFLLLVPWFIKSVAGVPALEHVPAIAGLCYFFCVFWAANSDNRLIFSDAYKLRNLRLEGLNLVLFLVGITLVIAALVNRGLETFSNDPLPVIGHIGVWTLLCCVGFMILAIFLDRLFASQEQHVTVIPGKFIGRAFLMLLLVPVVAHLGLSAAGVTWFELTGSFWIWFSLASVIAAAALIVVAYVRFKPGRENWLRPGIDFLVSKPTAKAYFSGSNRITRFLAYGTLAFLYWNFLLAPGIYGNERAKGFFDQVYTNELCAFQGRGSKDCDQIDLADEEAIAPVTPFVISATSLEEERERYFILHPDAFEIDCDPGASINDESFIYRLSKTDPRWQAIDCRPNSRNIIDKAFASGSPFPVFPATRIRLTDTEGTEWLVDGGYAHNVPIEAADALGADTIIVISSTPLHQDEFEIEDIEKLKYGNLAKNLTRLFPYLFGRSQVEDTLRAQQALVVTLSPTGGDGGWPPLTDFRAVTVERMIEEADKDRPLRIGMVESWGPPECTVGRVVYACGAIGRVSQTTGM